MYINYKEEDEEKYDNACFFLRGGKHLHASKLGELSPCFNYIGDRSIKWPTFEKTK
jgi:hypothetical protein